MSFVAACGGYAHLPTFPIATKEGGAARMRLALIQGGVFEATILLPNPLVAQHSQIGGANGRHSPVADKAPLLDKQRLLSALASGTPDANVPSTVAGAVVLYALAFRFPAVSLWEPPIPSDDTAKKEAVSSAFDNFERFMMGISHACTTVGSSGPRLAIYDASKFDSVVADVVFPVSGGPGASSVRWVSLQREILRHFSRSASVCTKCVLTRPYYDPSGEVLRFAKNRTQEQISESPTLQFEGSVVQVLRGDIYSVRVSKITSTVKVEELPPCLLVGHVVQVHLASVECYNRFGDLDHDAAVPPLYSLEDTTAATIAETWERCLVSAKLHRPTSPHSQSTQLAIPDRQLRISAQTPVVIADATDGYESYWFAKRHIFGTHVRCTVVHFKPSDKDLSNSTQLSTYFQREHFRAHVEVVGIVARENSDDRNVSLLSPLLCSLATSQPSERKGQLRSLRVHTSVDDSCQVWATVPCAPLLLAFGVAKISSSTMERDGVHTDIFLRQPLTHIEGTQAGPASSDPPSISAFSEVGEYVQVLEVLGALIETDMAVRRELAQGILCIQDSSVVNRLVELPSYLQLLQRYVMHGDPGGQTRNFAHVQWYLDHEAKRDASIQAPEWNINDANDVSEAASQLPVIDTPNLFSGWSRFPWGTSMALWPPPAHMQHGKPLPSRNTFTGSEAAARNQVLMENKITRTVTRAAFVLLCQEHVRSSATKYIQRMLQLCEGKQPARVDVDLRLLVRLLLRPTGSRNALEKTIAAIFFSSAESKFPGQLPEIRSTKPSSSLSAVLGCFLMGPGAQSHMQGATTLTATAVGSSLLFNNEEPKGVPISNELLTLEEYVLCASSPGASLPTAMLGPTFSGLFAIDVGGFVIHTSSRHLTVACPVTALATTTTTTAIVIDAGMLLKPFPSVERTEGGFMDDRLPSAFQLFAVRSKLPWLGGSAFTTLPGTTARVPVTIPMKMLASLTTMLTCGSAFSGVVSNIMFVRPLANTRQVEYAIEFTLCARGAFLAWLASHKNDSPAASAGTLKVIPSNTLRDFPLRFDRERAESIVKTCVGEEVPLLGQQHSDALPLPLHQTGGNRRNERTEARLEEQEEKRRSILGNRDLSSDERDEALACLDAMCRREKTPAVTPLSINASSSTVKLTLSFDAEIFTQASPTKPKESDGTTTTARDVQKPVFFEVAVQEFSSLSREDMAWKYFTTPTISPSEQTFNRIPNLDISIGSVAKAEVELRGPVNKKAKYIIVDVRVRETVVGQILDEQRYVYELNPSDTTSNLIAIPPPNDDAVVSLDDDEYELPMMAVPANDEEGLPTTETSENLESAQSSKGLPVHAPEEAACDDQPFTTTGTGSQRFVVHLARSITDRGSLTNGVASGGHSGIIATVQVTNVVGLPTQQETLDINDVVCAIRRVLVSRFLNQPATLIVDEICHMCDAGSSISMLCGDVCTQNVAQGLSSTSSVSLRNCIDHVVEANNDLPLPPSAHMAAHYAKVRAALVEDVASQSVTVTLDALASYKPPVPTTDDQKSNRKRPDNRGVAWIVSTSHPASCSTLLPSLGIFKVPISEYQTTTRLPRELSTARSTSASSILQSQHSMGSPSTSSLLPTERSVSSELTNPTLEVAAGAYVLAAAAMFPRMFTACHRLHHLKVMNKEAESAAKGAGHIDYVFNRLDMPTLPSVLASDFTTWGTRGALPACISHSPLFVAANPATAASMFRSRSETKDSSDDRFSTFSAEAVLRSGVETLVSDVRPLSSLITTLLFALPRSWPSADMADSGRRPREGGGCGHYACNAPANDGPGVADNMDKQAFFDASLDGYNRGIGKIPQRHIFDFHKSRSVGASAILDRSPCPSVDQLQPPPPLPHQLTLQSPASFYSRGLRGVATTSERKIGYNYELCVTEMKTTGIVEPVRVASALAPSVAEEGFIIYRAPPSYLTECLSSATATFPGFSVNSVPCCTTTEAPTENGETEPQRFTYRASTQLKLRTVARLIMGMGAATFTGPRVETNDTYYPPPAEVDTYTSELMGYQGVLTSSTGKSNVGLPQPLVVYHASRTITVFGDALSSPASPENPETENPETIFDNVARSKVVVCYTPVRIKSPATPHSLSKHVSIGQVRRDFVYGLLVSQRKRANELTDLVKMWLQSTPSANDDRGTTAAPEGGADFCCPADGKLTLVGSQFEPLYVYHRSRHAMRRALAVTWSGALFPLDSDASVACLAVLAADFNFSLGEATRDNSSGILEKVKSITRRIAGGAKEMDNLASAIGDALPPASGAVSQSAVGISFPTANCWEYFAKLFVKYYEATRVFAMRQQLAIQWEAATLHNHWALAEEAATRQLMLDTVSVVVAIATLRASMPPNGIGESPIQWGVARSSATADEESGPRAPPCPVVYCKSTAVQSDGCVFIDAFVVEEGCFNENGEYTGSFHMSGNVFGRRPSFVIRLAALPTLLLRELSIEAHTAERLEKWGPLHAGHSSSSADIEESVSDSGTGKEKTIFLDACVGVEASKWSLPYIPRAAASHLLATAAGRSVPSNQLLGPAYSGSVLPFSIHIEDLRD